MRRVIAVCGRHPRKQILVGFTGQQVAVVERRLAEFGQQRVARAVHLDRMVPLQLYRIKHGELPLYPRPRTMPKRPSRHKI
jgi:hypothetical protein